MPSSADAARRFARVRNAVFAVALATYVLSFVHRTAPAALAGELTEAFAISATALGTLAATYFYVYTLLQVPVGVLADTIGPRRLLAGGSFVAGVGSIVFALAPDFAVAATGRTLVGVGVATAFIAILKISATWFAPQRFATLNGITLFAGNLGAVAAGAPLAWLIGQASWRTVFVAIGLVSLALAAASWWLVRDRPEERGFPPVGARTDAARIDWRAALASVLRERTTATAFVVNLGIGGSYLAFAGLWAVPWLVQTRGYDRVLAAQHASLMLLGVAFGALAIGVVSDRLGNRIGVMRACTIAYAAAWLPWIAGVAWPPAATLAWCFVMGLLVPGFTLTWTIAKEANRPEHSGIATSVANVGIFLGAAILQPLVGVVLDRGRDAGDPAAAWSSAIVLLAGTAWLGALASLAVRTSTSVKREER